MLELRSTRAVVKDLHFFTEVIVLLCFLCVSPVERFFEGASDGLYTSLGFLISSFLGGIQTIGIQINCTRYSLES